MMQVTNFTQRHLNDSQILYEHNRPFANLTIYDSVSLEVTADFATQNLDITFHVRYMNLRLRCPQCEHNGG